MNAKILAVLAFIAIASATSGAFEDFEKKFDSEVHEKFEQWRVAFGREYEDFEYEFRKSVFAANLKKIEMLNKMDSGATYELNEFSDLTEQEFRQTRLGTRVNPKDVRGPKAESLFVRDLPTSFDWRQKGAVTPVKNQGQCGSCWAFSTTGNVEGQHFLKTGKLVSLSEQQLVDCDHNGDHGCEGGLPSNAFEYIAQNGGVDTESSYPYIGIDSKCKFEKSSVAATVANWTALSEDEDQMAAWLVKNGPISVGINAGNLQFYSKGISNPLFCSPSGIDHGVLIVGFGVGKSLFGKTEPYWIVKNSWGESWGEKGYFRLIRGKGKCGINKMATSAIV